MSESRSSIEDSKVNLRKASNVPTSAHYMPGNPFNETDGSRSVTRDTAFHVASETGGMLYEEQKQKFLHMSTLLHKMYDISMLNVMMITWPTLQLIWRNGHPTWANSTVELFHADGVTNLYPSPMEGQVIDHPECTEMGSRYTGFETALEAVRAFGQYHWVSPHPNPDCNHALAFVGYFDKTPFGGDIHCFGETAALEGGAIGLLHTDVRMEHVDELSAKMSDTNAILRGRQLTNI